MILLLRGTPSPRLQFVKTNLRLPLLTVAIIFALFISCNASQTPTTATTITSAKIAELLASGKNVKIVSAVIDGDLDFGAETKISGDVYFQKCVFKGSVKANDVRFNGNVIFLENEFQKDVEFQSGAIFGKVNFSKSIFKGKAIFANLAVWSKESYFAEIKADGKFSFENSDFHGNLSIMDSEFSKQFSLQETFILGNLQGSNAKFNGNTDFSMLTVLRRAIFKYSVFKTAPDFGNVKVER